MFGHRSDGKKVKNISPLFRIIPNVMLDRCDAQVYFKQDIPLKNMDAYISKKSEEGIKLSYMNIMFAAIVKIIAERPQLNRFAVNGIIYERDGIFVSLTMKKGMSDESEETTIKLKFDGTEDVFKVKEMMDLVISQNKELDNENGTDNLVKTLNLVPDWLLHLAVKFLMHLDKRGLLPKKIIEVSPFHTSVFLTNVGSIGIDSIYHHLYNFGTTSMFFSMGKKKKSYIYEDDEIKEEKCITIAFVGDERICDGYYYASSFKLLNRYLKHPELLEKQKIEKMKETEEML